MKGKLLKALLVLCLCFVPAFGVSAATSSNGTSDNLKKIAKEETEKDDLNRYRSGKVGFSFFNRNNGTQYSNIWLFSPNKGSDVSYMYAVKDEYGRLLIYGRGSVHYDLETIKNPDSNGPESSFGSNDWSLSLYDGGKGKGLVCSAPYDESKPKAYYTNIPIFSKDNLDAIKAYEESGDISGADNIDDISSENIDGTIEVPHGLKISGEFSFGTIQKVFHDKLLSFGWSIPEMEGLTYDAQFKFNYLDKKQNTENGIDSGWYDWRNNIEYSYDSAAMILDVVNKVQGVNWLASARTSLGLSMDDCYSVTFRVRNRKGNKVSNWVEIQLGQDGKATARETDLNGNTQKSDEYNEDTNPSTNDDNPGSNDFYDWVKDNTDNANNSDSSTSSNGLTSSIKDLKAFITSGFGLLGSNGIIALMSGLFSYIPASVWTLIKAAISMTILVMLIGLLKNLVFG